MELTTSSLIQGITIIMANTTMDIITMAMASKVKINIEDLLIMEIITVSTSIWKKKGEEDRRVAGRVLLVN